MPPALWLRYRGSPQGGSEIRVGLKAWGLAFAWFAVFLAITYALASLLESA